jgi:hypothetical protein
MILGQAAADRLALMYDADVTAAASRMNGSDLRVHVFPADTGEHFYMGRLPGETSWHVPGCGTLDDRGLIHELQSRGLSTRATVSALDARW